MMIDRLIRGLEIRQKQLSNQFQGYPVKYKIHQNHHMKDVMTVLAVLKEDENAEALLKNVPTEEDYPPVPQPPDDDGEAEDSGEDR
jgi:predicted FMN-binding regulatory protein PaiB